MVEGVPRHDCACDFADAAGFANSPHCMRKGRGATWRSDAEGDATGGVVNVPRYLCRRGDVHQHAGAFETDVAAAGGSNPWAGLRRGDGEHVGDVRRLKSG